MSLITPIPIIDSFPSTTSPLPSASPDCYPVIKVQQCRRSPRDRKPTNRRPMVYDQNSPSSSDSSPPQDVKPGTHANRTTKRARQMHTVFQGHEQKGVIYDCIVVKSGTSGGAEIPSSCHSMSPGGSTHNTNPQIGPASQSFPTSMYRANEDTFTAVGYFGNRRSQRIAYAHTQAAIATTTPTPNIINHESSFSFSSSATCKLQSRAFRDRGTSPSSRSKSLSSSTGTTTYQPSDNDSGTDSDGYPSVTSRSSSTISRPCTRSNTRCKQNPGDLPTTSAFGLDTNTLPQSLSSLESTPSSPSSAPSGNSTKPPRRRRTLTASDTSTTKYPGYLENYLREKMQVQEEGALEGMEVFVEEIVQRRGLTCTTL